MERLNTSSERDARFGTSVDSSKKHNSFQTIARVGGIGMAVVAIGASAREAKGKDLAAENPHSLFLTNEIISSSEDDSIRTIVYNVFDQNEASAQDDLILAHEQSINLAIRNGIPGDAMEAGVKTLPTDRTTVLVPTIVLNRDLDQWKKGSLVIPYVLENGVEGVAVFNDPDGAEGEQYTFDFILNEEGTLAMPVLTYSASAEPTPVSMLTFTKEAQTAMPYVQETPVYQASVASESMRLRDPNTQEVLDEVPRNTQLLVVGDLSVQLNGGNALLRNVIGPDGKFYKAAQDLMQINRTSAPTPEELAQQIAMANPVNAEAFRSAENAALQEGITIQASALISEQIFPDVAPRPIIIQQSTEMNNQPEKYRTGKMSLNNIPSFLPIDETPGEAPNFTLDGQASELSGFETISVAVDQAVWRIARGQGSIPEETTLEQFKRDYRDVEVLIYTENAEMTPVRADAPVVFRFRGFEQTQDHRPGVVRTNWGSSSRKIENGTLFIDMYYGISDNVRPGFNFSEENSWFGDEWNSTRLFESAIMSLHAKDTYADFVQTFGMYYYHAGYSPNSTSAPDLSVFYNPNIQVLLENTRLMDGDISFDQAIQNENFIFNFTR